MNIKYAVYIVSIDIDREEKTRDHLAFFGFNDIVKLKCKITKENHGIGAGLSHQDCVKHAKSLGYTHTLVFEDDTRLDTNTTNIFPHILEYIENNNDWEYLAFSHTLLGRSDDKWVPGGFDVSFAKKLVCEKNIRRVSDHIFTIENIKHMSQPVIGNSCCVMYNNASDKFLTDFDPWNDQWMDIWSPKNLKTLLINPIIATQYDKPWQKDHCLDWGKLLSSIK